MEKEIQPQECEICHFTTSHPFYRIIENTLRTEKITSFQHIVSATIDNDFNIVEIRYKLYDGQPKDLEGVLVLLSTTPKIKYVFDNTLQSRDLKMKQLLHLQSMALRMSGIQVNPKSLYLLLSVCDSVLSMGDQFSLKDSSDLEEQTRKLFSDQEKRAET